MHADCMLCLHSQLYVGTPSHTECTHTVLYMHVQWGELYSAFSYVLLCTVGSTHCSLAKNTYKTTDIQPTVVLRAFYDDDNGACMHRASHRCVLLYIHIHVHTYTCMCTYIVHHIHYVYNIPVLTACLFQAKYIP